MKRMTILLTVVMLSVFAASALAQGVFPVQTGKLLPPESNAEYRFGWSVDFDGDYAVFGSYGDAVGDDDNIGAAWVFKRSGDGWQPIQKLTPPDARPLGEFGWDVAISGGTIVVSAPGDYDEGGDMPGQVYTFDRSGETWAYQQTLTPGGSVNSDLFGFDLKLAGNTLLVGAPGTSNNVGAAFVFERSGTWSQSQALIPADAIANKGFGLSVDFDGNNMLIGAPFDENGGGLFASGQGAVYPYAFDGNTWQAGTKFTFDGVEGVQSSTILGDFFGNAISLDGDTAAISAWQDRNIGADSEGAVRIFTTTDGLNWAEGGTRLVPLGDFEDGFGYSVQLEGDTLLISADDDGINVNPLTGTPLPDGDGDESGVLYHFQDYGNAWVLVEKIVPDDNEADDFFGMQFAFDGTEALVGAWGDDDAVTNVGAVYDLTLNPLPPVEPNYDVNRDGFVTPADAMFVLNRLGEPRDSSNSRADVDRNGQIETADVNAVIDAIGETVAYSGAPEIVLRPTNVLFVSEGDSQQLSVIARGTGPVRYEWFLGEAPAPGGDPGEPGSVPAGNIAVGTNSPTYSPPGDLAPGTYRYWVRVSNSVSNSDPTIQPAFVSPASEYTVVAVD